MLRALLYSEDNWTQTVLRITLGIVLFPHGAQKLLGWFGGPGFAGATDHLMIDFGLPGIVAFLVIIIEFFGPLLLLAGLLTRINALSILGLFVGIILTAHLEQGFFMNWFGQMEAGQEGFEYHLLVLGMSLALIISGGGKYSADLICYKNIISE